ncbi:MAG: FG-GAP repeat domain-containing protein [bacterium]
MLFFKKEFLGKHFLNRTVRFSAIFLYIFLFSFFVLLISGAGEAVAQSIDSKKVEAAQGSTIYLSQAQFIEKEGKDGKMHPVPGPARLVILTRTKSGWMEEAVEDPDSNVFHKAAWFVPSSGEPGILTIGATGAFLKIWRKKGGKWKSEVLWHPSFGGKFDRLRDFEITDITGDGIKDIVVATHDQGVIAVVSQEDGKWKAEELCRNKDTFVHEIETGDVDGDKIIEIFATPSKPNKLDGSIQPGSIEMWKFVNGNRERRVVESFESRHVKEILCIPIKGEENPVLFASLEGEHFGRIDEGDTTRIRMYRFDKEKISYTDIANLPGKLCRFLTFGDTDGDGVRELIASTRVSGIWRLTPPLKDIFKNEWKKTLIEKDSSGFEHATYLYDFNGDGIEEIYVASDDQKEIRCYWFNGRDYSVDVLKGFNNDVITFNLTANMIN